MAMKTFTASDDYRLTRRQ